MTPPAPGPPGGRRISMVSFSSSLGRDSFLFCLRLPQGAKKRGPPSPGWSATVLASTMPARQTAGRGRPARRTAPGPWGEGVPSSLEKSVHKPTHPGDGSLGSVPFLSADGRHPATALPDIVADIVPQL